MLDTVIDIIGDVIIIVLGIFLILEGMRQTRLLRSFGLRLNPNWQLQNLTIVIGALVVSVGAVFLIIDSLVLLLIIAFFVGALSLIFWISSGKPTPGR